MSSITDDAAQERWDAASAHGVSATDTIDLWFEDDVLRANEDDLRYLTCMNSVETLITAKGNSFVTSSSLTLVTDVFCLETSHAHIHLHKRWRNPSRGISYIMRDDLFRYVIKHTHYAIYLNSMYEIFCTRIQTFSSGFVVGVEMLIDRLLRAR